MFVTVGVLKSWLKDYSDETLVFISSDAEGNSTMPMSENVAKVECDSKGKIYYKTKPKKIIPGIIMYPQHGEADEEW